MSIPHTRQLLSVYALLSTLVYLSLCQHVLASCDSFASSMHNRKSGRRFPDFARYRLNTCLPVGNLSHNRCGCVVHVLLPPSKVDKQPPTLVRSRTGPPEVRALPAVP